MNTAGDGKGKGRQKELSKKENNSISSLFLSLLNRLRKLNLHVFVPNRQWELGDREEDSIFKKGILLNGMSETTRGRIIMNHSCNLSCSSHES